MAYLFDLTQNPFYLLNLSVRADRNEIAYAYEDALADGRAEESALLRARQEVQNPRHRLEAELSWLLGSGHPTGLNLLHQVEVGAAKEALQALSSFEGLDRANMAAHLCCRRPGAVGFPRALLLAYRQISEKETLTVLNRWRSDSGFPILDGQRVSEALENLRARHVKAAVQCVTESGDPGEAMRRIVEEFLHESDSGSRVFLGQMIREYDAWTEPRLGEIKERIEAAAARCEEGGGREAVLQITELLAEWDAISQPVQLIEEKKGHEEPRSAEICRIVLNLYRNLADEDRIEDALILARTLLEIFPELPTIANRISDDIGHIELSSSMKALDALMQAADSFKESRTQYNYVIKAKGFGPAASGSVRELYDAFITAVDKTEGTIYQEMPWLIVRKTVIEMHNNQVLSHQAARSITQGILDHFPPPKVAERLLRDLRDLERHEAWDRLKSQSLNYDEKLTLVAELLDGADAEEREGLLIIRSALIKKIADRKARRWGVAVVIAIIIIVGIVANINEKRSTTPPRETTSPLSGTRVDPPPWRPTTPPRETTSPLSGTRVAPPSQPTVPRIEQKPPVGSNRLLSENEVRYCVFQKERLVILESMLKNMSDGLDAQRQKLDAQSQSRFTSQAALDRYNADVDRYNADLVANRKFQDRYNALVQDYNARCSSFRYRPGVLQKVQREASLKRAALEKDAQIIFNSW